MIISKPNVYRNCERKKFIEELCWIGHGEKNSGMGRGVITWIQPRFCHLVVMSAIFFFVNKPAERISFSTAHAKRILLLEAERARTSSASFKSKGNELKRTSTGPVTLASPPGIKPWSLRSVGNVLDYGSSAALSLGGLFGSKEVFVGKRGDQETATGKSHRLGYLFGLQDMGHALLIFIGAPIVEWFSCHR